MSSGTCKVCGCTDQDCGACWAATGLPCFWVDKERTLCSRCTEGGATAITPTPTYELGLTEERRQLVISRVDGAALRPEELTSFFDAMRIVVERGGFL